MSSGLSAVTYNLINLCRCDLRCWLYKTHCRRLLRNCECVRLSCLCLFRWCWSMERPHDLYETLKIFSFIWSYIRMVFYMCSIAKYFLTLANTMQPSERVENICIGQLLAYKINRNNPGDPNIIQVVSQFPKRSSWMPL